jgi:hypothetical protein
MDDGICRDRLLNIFPVTFQKCICIFNRNTGFIRGHYGKVAPERTRVLQRAAAKVVDSSSNTHAPREMPKSYRRGFNTREPGMDGNSRHCQFAFLNPAESIRITQRRCY